MAFIATPGPFPDAAMPVYGTAIFPSTMIARPWNPMAGHPQPGPGGFTMPPSIGAVGTTSMWMSNAPIYGQVAVKHSPKWARYLSSGDQLWGVLLNGKEITRDEVHASSMAVFNQFMLNHWLRDMHAKAITHFEDLPVDFFDVSEDFQGRKIDEYLSRGAPANKTYGSLRYLTKVTMSDVVLHLGPNGTQTNDLKPTTDRIEHGRTTADLGDPMVTFGVRGPHEMRNVWGSMATVGAYLFFVIVRWPRKAPAGVFNDEGEVNNYMRTSAAERSFQVVAHVENGFKPSVPDDVRTYDGLSVYTERTSDNRLQVHHFQEYGKVIYVGQVLSGNRRTLYDNSGARTRAEGLPGENVPAATLPSSCQTMASLETIRVEVDPRIWGDYVHPM